MIQYILYNFVVNIIYNLYKMQGAKNCLKGVTVLNVNKIRAWNKKFIL